MLICIQLRDPLACIHQRCHRIFGWSTAGKQSFRLDRTTIFHGINVWKSTSNYIRPFIQIYLIDCTAALLHEFLHQLSTLLGVRLNVSSLSLPTIPWFFRPHLESVLWVLLETYVAKKSSTSSSKQSLMNCLFSYFKCIIAL